MEQNRPMPDYAFSVTYDGPALDSNSMLVRDLAPALVAFADMIDDARRIEYPTATTPGLAIAATTPGSFNIVLHLVEAGFFQKVADLFNSAPVTAVVNGGQLVSWVIGGLVIAGQHRRIRRIQNDQPREGWARITLVDETTLDLPLPSVRLAQDVDFRRHARDAVIPLQPGTIDRLTVTSRESSVTVNADQVGAFALPDIPEQLINDSTYDTVVRLVNISFANDHKWKVSDGDTTFWVQLLDQDFLNRVQRNEESFRSGDLLRVKIQARQWRASDGDVRNERVVIEVLNHVQGTQQIPLFPPNESTTDGT